MLDEAKVKKVVLWGGGKYGDRAYEILNNRYNKEIEICFWCDSSKEKQGGEKYGKKVISPEELEIKWREKAFDMVIVTTEFCWLNEIAKRLAEGGIKEAYYIFDKHYFTANEKIGLEQLLNKIDLTKPCLEYYEYHICDHCNLSCKGCSNLSNICEEKFSDLQQYKKDMERLKELFWGVRMIKLLGGEPLLNPELPEFIRETRKVFPECDLRIGTNGLLITQIKEDVFDAMRECDAYFFISSYPMVRRIRGRIEAYCEERKVQCVFSPDIDEFFNQIYSEKDTANMSRTYEECKKRMGHCFNLREGKLSPCVLLYINIYNEKYNKNMEITENDIFDIYKETDGWELNRKLYQPTPFCAYCGDPVKFPWKNIKRSEIRMSDYVIDRRGND